MALTEYRELIDRIAAFRNLDPDLIEAMVMTESGGKFWAYRYEPAFFVRYLKDKPEFMHHNPHEVSASFGLMQLMYTTALEEGYIGDPWGLFNPETSIEMGCRHLARHLQWAQKLGGKSDMATRSALAAYNGGRRGNEPDAVIDRNAVYAEKVLSWLPAVRRARQGT